MIELTLNNLDNLARGTAFLATGGGGDHNFHYYDMCPKSVLLFNQEIFFIWFP